MSSNINNNQPNSPNHSPTIKMINDHLPVVGLILLVLWLLTNLFGGAQGFHKETFQIKECVITREEVDNQDVYECQYALNNSPDPEKREVKEILIKGIVEHHNGEWTRAISLLVELDASTGEIVTDRFGVIHPLNVTPVKLTEPLSSEKGGCFVILDVHSNDYSSSLNGWVFTQDPLGNWKLERQRTFFSTDEDVHTQHTYDYTHLNEWYHYLRYTENGKVSTVITKGPDAGLEPCIDYSADYTQALEGDIPRADYFSTFIAKEDIPPDLNVLRDLPKLLQFQ